LFDNPFVELEGATIKKTAKEERTKFANSSLPP
jgi:hypothetical protein